MVGSCSTMRGRYRNDSSNTLDLGLLVKNNPPIVREEREGEKDSMEWHGKSLEKVYVWTHY